MAKKRFCDCEEKWRGNARVMWCKTHNMKATTCIRRGLAKVDEWGNNVIVEGVA